MKRLAVFTLAGFATSLCLLTATSAFAADAGLARILPRGAQRGTEIEVTFVGKNLKDAQEVVFYDSGITAKEIKPVDGGSVKMKFAIAPDARLGDHSMRLRTATGMTDLRTFFVGPFASVEEVEPNNEFAKPQPIPLNVTVTGVIKNEDVDYFVVEAKKGDRITAEVEGLRLSDGDNLRFDPFLAILDENRFELTASDDSALLLQDPIVSVVAPKDGKYIIQLRDASYDGSDASYYRMHVGNFPRPRTIYPAGGKVGDDVNVQFLGDVLGTFTHSLRLPDKPNPKLGIFPEQNGLTAPSPCYFRVSEFGNVLESEPNNDAKSATVYSGELPIAFNGVIATDNDYDWFRFKAKKGQTFDINVYARRVRSPLDPVLVINKDGKDLATNDDSGGPDSYLRFQVPEDGEYNLVVMDQLRRGSPDAVYRVEVTPVQAELSFSIPPVDPNGNSQERQTVVVPKGNRYATLMRVRRKDVGGEVALTAPQLPAGVKMISENIAANVDVVPVVFEAAPDAAVGGGLVDVQGKALDPNAGGLTGGVKQSVVLVGNGNQSPYLVSTVDKVAIAVSEEAVYKIRLEEPKIPLVQAGSMGVKVIAERKSGFTGPIHVRLLWAPPGVGAGDIDIPANQNEAVMPLNANGNAQVKKWKICVLCSADQPEGRQWVSSQLIDLDVAPSILTGKIDLAATEQGKPAQVVVHLDTKTKFEGEATLKLLGLPNAATAPDLKVKAGDTQLVFDVKTDPKTPVGQHNSLVCQLILPQNGDQIVQNLANGGKLRVDAPPPPKAGDDKKPSDAKAQDKKPGEPAKILTRLEKLRLEQQAKAAGK
jgi:hypothetical protein